MKQSDCVEWYGSKHHVMVDVGHTTKQHQELRVSLRGKLAQDYVRLRNRSEEMASQWIRKLCVDAVRGHPQLSYRMEEDSVHGQRFVVGLTKELGTMGDW